ncbi:MAG: cytochrome c [Sedimenticola sp.]|nr:cytochrome c [Sedimenticola sp.]
MNKINRPYPFILLLVVLALAMMPVALMAHGKATGIVKERMELMKKIGKQMRSISIMKKGKIPFNAEKISNHAETISHSSSKIPALFPEGSLQKPTEALPAIWEQWDQFLYLTDQLKLEAVALQEVAKQEDKQAILVQFEKLGKTCNGCHQDFRVEDD